MDYHGQHNWLIVTYCSSLCFVTVIKIPDQKYLGKNRFILCILACHNPALREARARAQGRKLDAGTGEEAMEENCLLACSPRLYLLALLCIEDRLPRDDMAHSRLGSTNQSLIKEMLHMPPGQCLGAGSSLAWVALSLVTICVKMTKYYK